MGPHGDSPLVVTFTSLCPALLSVVKFDGRVPRAMRAFSLSGRMLAKGGGGSLMRPCCFMGFSGRTANCHKLHASQCACTMRTASKGVSGIVLFSHAGSPRRVGGVTDRRLGLARAFGQRLGA